jgi:hypothetical protein
MKHPLTFLLRIGRSAHERAPLLGDLEEECRARLARGSNHPAVFVWYTAEILRAFFWGLRDAIAPSYVASRIFAPCRCSPPPTSNSVSGC